MERPLDSLPKKIREHERKLSNEIYRPCKLKRQKSSLETILKGLIKTILYEIISKLQWSTQKKPFVWKAKHSTPRRRVPYRIASDIIDNTGICCVCNRVFPKNKEKECQKHSNLARIPPPKQKFDDILLVVGGGHMEKNWFLPSFSSANMYFLIVYPAY